MLSFENLLTRVMEIRNHLRIIKKKYFWFFRKLSGFNSFNLIIYNLNSLICTNFPRTPKMDGKRLSNVLSEQHRYAGSYLRKKVSGPNSRNQEVRQDPI